MKQPLDGRPTVSLPNAPPADAHSTVDRGPSPSQPDPYATRPLAEAVPVPGITSVAELIDLLRDTGWLSREYLEEIVRQRGQFDEPRTLARALVQRGWATPFQVNELFRGRGRQLVLGAYVLVERLGEGGMGQVFKAFHPVMHRHVALKVIRPEHCDTPAARQRFLVEIRALASLGHPNIIQVFDARDADGALYFVMEYLPGNDLGKLVKQGHPLAVARVCDWVRQAALGLQHAHERGLVHRDVKPSNLLLTADAQAGTVKLLDLGLVRVQQPAAPARGQHAPATAAGAPLTFCGTVMGTPDYIAPEQILDAHGVDIRGDVYSLGCTLYHLLAGEPPFAAAPLWLEKFRLHQSAEPQALEEVRGDVPVALAAVCRKMMAKDPARRYQTPGAVAAALAPFAGHASADARPLVNQAEVVTATWSNDVTDPTAVVVPVKPRWNRFLLAAGLTAGLCVVLAFLACGSGVVAMFYLGNSSHSGGQVDPQLSAVVAHPDPVVDRRPVLKDGEPAVLPALPADNPARLIKELKGHTGDIQCLGFSRDGKWLASGADDHQARLWDGLTGDERGLPLPLAEPVRALTYSPDGKRLAVAAYGLGSEGSVTLFDPAGLALPQALPWKDKPGNPDRAEVHGLAFSPDGKRLAAGGGPLRVWDLAKGGPPTVFEWQKISPSTLYAVTFAPDGETVAAGCLGVGDSVRLWEVDKPAEPRLLQGNKETTAHNDVRGVVAYAAGGKLLVRVTADTWRGFADPSASVMVWDVDAKGRVTLRDTFKIPSGRVFALACAADGHLRVAAGAGEPGFGGGLGRPEPAPGEVKLWDSVTRKVHTFETGHKGSIMALAFSPDGTRLATGSADQTAKLWDLTR